jgi:ribosomal 50S subunit-associated protein YjgA (DUF615 family)
MRNTKKRKVSGKPPTLRELYLTLSEKELAEAEERLDRYLEWAVRLYERLRKNPRSEGERRQLGLLGCAEDLTGVAPCYGTPSQ